MPAAYTSTLAETLAADATDRLVRYARIDTQSVRDRTQSPSSPRQLDLSRLLVKELRTIGLADASLDDNGYVMASLDASGAAGEHVIGLIAHVDVSPDAPAEGVEPIVHRDWDGTPIVLPRGGTVLDPARMPELAPKVGHDIVTSSGDTLLGADDKAGIAAIMAALAHLTAHPELPRPHLRVCFTPDEEIGEGATLFDLERFGAQCAYTLDAPGVATLQDETFTAAAVDVVVEGVDVHPGFATGVLVNAARLVAQILAALPCDRLTPETTSGREGFLHPYEISGNAARATLRLIARDFEDDLLAEHIALVRRTAEEVVAREPRAKLTVTDHAQYPNMRAHVAPFPEIVARAERAIRAEGLAPVRTPIRGGTDGSVLSARGLPTPNLFCGGYEYHSVREWASAHELASAAATVVRLAQQWAAA